MIRVYGVFLTVGGLGEFAADGMTPPIMLVSGIACISSRDGFPSLRVLGVLLTLTAIGMVGDSDIAQKAAMAMTVAAAVALRIETSHCLGCGVGMEERDGWRFCAQRGAGRGRRG